MTTALILLAAIGTPLAILFIHGSAKGFRLMQKMEGREME